MKFVKPFVVLVALLAAMFVVAPVQAAAPTIVVKAQNENTTAANSITATIPGGGSTTAGDTILLAVAQRDINHLGGSFNVSDSGSNSYTLFSSVATTFGGGTHSDVAIFKASGSTSAASSFTATDLTSSHTDGWVIFALEVTNASGWDVTAKATGSGTSIDTGVSATSNHAAEVVITAMAWNTLATDGSNFLLDGNSGCCLYDAVGRSSATNDEINLRVITDVTTATHTFEGQDSLGGSGRDWGGVVGGLS